MQRHRRFWGALLAAVLAVGILPAASAADKDGPSAPGLAALATDPGGLNGLSGQNDDFDYTRYDAVIDISDIVYEFGTHNGFYYELRDDFTWPGGITILITVGHSSDEAVLDYIDVPGGKSSMCTTSARLWTGPTPSGPTTTPPAARRPASLPGPARAVTAAPSPTSSPARGITTP